MERIYKLIPKYAFFPILVSLVLNMCAYFGTRLFTDSLYHYDWSIPLDHNLPLVPFFAIPYVLAYIPWIVGVIIIVRDNKELCYKIMTAEQIAKFICLIFFVFWPTEIIRPAITGDSFSECLTRLVYHLDEPNNLFPSIHCLLSWIVFRGTVKCKKTGIWIKIFMFAQAIIVFASVVLIKQHVVVDIIGGIAAVEIGIFVSEKLKLYKIYYSLEAYLKKCEYGIKCFLMSSGREDMNN